MPRKDRIAKGETRLTFEQAAALGEGMIALVPAPDRPDAAFEARLAAWREAWPDGCIWPSRPCTAATTGRRINRLAAMAERTGAPMIATNAVLYHHPDAADAAGRADLRPRGNHHRQGGPAAAGQRRALPEAAAEMARLFRGHEAALARTLEVLEACRFSLDELGYQLPRRAGAGGLLSQRRRRSQARPA